MKLILLTALLAASIHAQQTRSGSIVIQPRPASPSGASRAIQTTAASAACPLPPVTGINATVTATVTLDRKTSLYTYQYTVNNTGTKDIWDVAVSVTSPVSGVSQPSNWGFAPFGDGTGDPVPYNWHALSMPVAPGTLSGIAIPPPANPLKPGTSMTFSFKSKLPPGPVPFYVLGDLAVDNPFEEPIPPDATEEDAEILANYNVELLADNCPELSGDFFDMAMLGVTQGPVTALGITIDISPGIPAPNPITPKSDGIIYVAILGSKTFDARTVDPSTAVFGPQEAPARAYVIEDVNGDGRLDMYLQFGTLDTGIHCQDKVAFLHAKTTQGRVVQGFDSIAPSCP